VYRRQLRRAELDDLYAPLRRGWLIIVRTDSAIYRRLAYGGEVGA
jgi:hypothetical protein